MRVFIVEPTRKNLDHANLDDFGEVTFIFKKWRSVNPFEVEQYSAELIRLMEEQEFNPSEDVFCIAGGLITLSVCLTAILRRYRTIKVLMFASLESAYVQRTLSVETYNHSFV